MRDRPSIFAVVPSKDRRGLAGIDTGMFQTTEGSFLELVSEAVDLRSESHHLIGFALDRIGPDVASRCLARRHVVVESGCNENGIVSLVSRLAQLPISAK